MKPGIFNPPRGVGNAIWPKSAASRRLTAPFPGIEATSRRPPAINYR
jgi:hypothetical protein